MSMRRIDFPMDPSDFHDFYRLRPFLSLKMWTFGAIPIEVRDTGH